MVTYTHRYLYKEEFVYLIQQDNNYTYFRTQENKISHKSTKLFNRLYVPLPPPALKDFNLTLTQESYGGWVGEIKILGIVVTSLGCLDGCFECIQDSNDYNRMNDQELTYDLSKEQWDRLDKQRDELAEPFLNKDNYLEQFYD